MQTARRVAVAAGNRVPCARSDGPYATASNQDLLTAALDGLAARTGSAWTRRWARSTAAVSTRRAPRSPPAIPSRRPVPGSSRPSLISWPSGTLPAAG